MKNANPVSGWVGAAAAALALVLAACSKQPQAAPALKTSWDHFTVAVGGHPASLQVAIVGAEQERGLMQRRDLGADEGMIFVYPRPIRQSFWMKNTPEALDIAYVDREGVISEICPMLPMDERAVVSRSDRIQFAVEMPHGWFESHGVRPGDRVDLGAVTQAARDRGFEPSKLGLR